MSFEPVIYIQATRNAPTKKVLKSIKSFLAANQPTQEFENSVVPKLSNVSEEILVNLRQIAAAVETDTIEYANNLSNASLDISDPVVKKRKNRGSASIVDNSKVDIVQEIVEEDAVVDDSNIAPEDSELKSKKKSKKRNKDQQNI